VPIAERTRGRFCDAGGPYRRAGRNIGEPETRKSAQGKSIQEKEGRSSENTLKAASSTSRVLVTVATQLVPNVANRIDKHAIGLDDTT
jgi:hypothetical protein